MQTIYVCLFTLHREEENIRGCTIKRRSNVALDGQHNYLTQRDDPD